MQRLSKTPGTSLHRQLFIVLRERILQGEYEPGSSIPSEDELCAIYGVSRITVRRAVSDLENEGLLQKRPPKGTFVTPNVPTIRASATLTLIDSLKKAADETVVEVLAFESIVPPVRISRQLAVPEDSRAVRVVRLRSKKDTPVMITDAWVPEGVTDRITKNELSHRPLFEILMQSGIKFGRVAQEITAVSASPEAALLLKTEIGQPLVQMTRLIYDIKRRPIQHLTVLFSPERSRILMDISASDVNTLSAGSIFHEV